MRYWSVTIDKRSIFSHAPEPIGTFVVGAEGEDLPDMEPFLSGLQGVNEYLNHNAFSPCGISDEDALAKQDPVFTGEDYKVWKLNLTE